MEHPEKVIQLVIEDRSEVDAVLYHVRILLQQKLAIAKGPVMLHLGRQMLPGAYNGDGKNHAEILSEHRFNQKRSGGRR